MNSEGEMISMKSATIQLESLVCPSCMQKIESAVKSIGGVDQESIKVMFNSSKVKLNYDEEKVSIDEIENSIKRLGYEVVNSKVK